MSCNLLNTVYWKWTTEQLYRYRMVVSARVVYPRDCVADWELWLPLPSTSREGHTEYHHLGKRSTFKTQSMVSTECVRLSHHHKEKTVSWTMVNWEPSVYILQIVWTCQARQEYGWCYHENFYSQCLNNTWFFFSLSSFFHPLLFPPSLPILSFLFFTKKQKQKLKTMKLLRLNLSPAP